MTGVLIKLLLLLLAWGFKARRLSNTCQITIWSSELASGWGGLWALLNSSRVIFKQESCRLWYECSQCSNACGLPVYSQMRPHWTTLCFCLKFKSNATLSSFNQIFLIFLHRLFHMSLGHVHDLWNKQQSHEAVWECSGLNYSELTCLSC